MAAAKGYCLDEGHNALGRGTQGQLQATDLHCRMMTCLNGESRVLQTRLKCHWLYVPALGTLGLRMRDWDNAVICTYFRPS
jgi:hypothetical protein